MQESDSQEEFKERLLTDSRKSLIGKTLSASSTELEYITGSNFLGNSPLTKSHSRKPSRVQIVEPDAIETASSPNILTDRQPEQEAKESGNFLAVQKSDVRQLAKEKSFRRSVMRNSTSVGVVAEQQNAPQGRRSSSIMRKSTLFQKENLTWEDIFGKFLKDIGVNLQTEKLKEKKDIFNNNPFLRNVPIGPKVEFFKEEYMHNFENFLNGEMSMADLINNNNFPSLTKKKIHFESLLKMSKNPDGYRKPTLKEIRLALNKINEMERQGVTNLLPEEQKANEVSSPRNQGKGKTLKDFVTTEKLRTAVMNNILTGKINERRDLIHERKKESVREVKLLKNFYNISTDYVAKIKNRNLLQDQQQGGSLYSLRNTLRLKNHVILTEDSSKHMVTTASSHAPDLNSYNQKLFQQYLHNKVFVSSNDYLKILQDYKKFSQEFRRRIINPGLLDGIRSERGQDKAPELGNRETLTARGPSESELAKKRGKKTFLRKTLSSVDMTLTDYLYNSQVLNNQKAGMMPPVGMPDVFNEGDEEQMRTSCLKFKKDAEKTRNREKKDYFRDIGRLKRRGGGSERVVESKSINIGRNQVAKVPEFDIHDDMSDDDCLPSLTEQTLDHLYSQSIALQKNIMKRNKEGFPHRMKQLMKLEELTGQSIKVNKVKLKIQK